MTKEGVIEILAQLEEFSGNTGQYLVNEWTHAPHIATIATQDEKAVWPDENMQIRFNTVDDTLDTRRVSYQRQDIDETLMISKTSLYQSIKFQEIVSIALVTDRVKRAAYKYGNTL